MNVDNITQRLISIALKTIKQQRKESLAKIRFWDELEKVLKEFVKQSKADARAWRGLRNYKLPPLTRPPNGRIPQMSDRAGA